MAERDPGGDRLRAPGQHARCLHHALKAAGGYLGEELDGVDLVPYVDGTRDGRPHDALFWRRRRSHAVRVFDLKLVVYEDGPAELFDLAADPGEQHDLAAERPWAVRRLQARYETWAEGLVEPLWASSASDPPPVR